MELMLNELSIHGQFYDTASLRDALGRIMSMRNLARRFGREIYCHQGTSYRPAQAETPLIQMIQTLSREQRNAVLSWLDRHGPFWDEDPHHDSRDLFGCNDEVVTDSGLAESAYCKHIGIDRRMVSVSPSEWNYTPITVNWLRQNDADEDIDVCNYWESSTLETALEQSPSNMASWRQLEDAVRQRFVNLNFTPDSFSYLAGQPFAESVAKSIRERLNALDRLWSVGLGSDEGRQLFDNHFMGDNAWFSDSSDSEKRKFRKELTFDIADQNANHFCPWHGKVNTARPYRIHFTWPVQPGGQLYVVYVGLKITRR